MEPWWQVDFMSMRTVMRITMGSNDYTDGYVTMFSLSYSYDGKNWYQVKDPKTNKSQVWEFLMLLSLAHLVLSSHILISGNLMSVS